MVVAWHHSEVANGDIPYRIAAHHTFNRISDRITASNIDDGVNVLIILNRAIKGAVGGPRAAVTILLANGNAELIAKWMTGLAVAQLHVKTSEVFAHFAVIGITGI